MASEAGRRRETGEDLKTLPKNQEWECSPVLLTLPSCSDAEEHPTLTLWGAQQQLGSWPWCVFNHRYVGS